MHKIGLSLKRDFIDELIAAPRLDNLDFLEIAPENWMQFGGKFQHQLELIAQKYSLYCHGLSLSIGSLDPLDIQFVTRVKEFLNRYQIEVYSEHLSYCSSNGHLYDLLPIPFDKKTIEHLTVRIDKVQEILQRPLILENSSYYLMLSDEMLEADFINEVLRRTGASMLLDVNNVYVNSTNHNYDPYAYIRSINTDKIAYLHVAGHYYEADGFIVDTHGTDVIDPVWDLLQFTYKTHGIKPTLLERDFNIPNLAGLGNELTKIRQIQKLFDATENTYSI